MVSLVLPAVALGDCTGQPDGTPCDAHDGCNAPDSCVSQTCVASAGGGDIDFDGICNFDDLDDDGDGVDDTIEDGCESLPGSPIGPFGGDGDGDGILDSIERNTTSLPTATLRGCVTLKSSCDQNFNVRVFNESELGQDSPFDYPFGLIGFSLCNRGVVNCTFPCSQSDVTEIYHGATDLSRLTLRKFGPLVPGDPGTEQFYTLPVVTMAGQSASFRLRDGFTGDATDFDGVIVDPSGPAATAADLKQTPALGPWAMAAAITSLLGVGYWSLRRIRDLMPC
jgi:hypothetical protein